MQFSVNNANLEVRIRPPEDYERLYEPHPDAEPLPPPVSSGAFQTEILFDHPREADLRARIIADVLVSDTGVEFPEQFIDLFMTLTLETTDDNGIPSDPRLQVEVVQVDLAGETLDASCPT